MCHTGIAVHDLFKLRTFTVLHGFFQIAELLFHRDKVLFDAEQLFVNGVGT